jgi:heme-degrading monooxygenase HmoA
MLVFINRFTVHGSATEFECAFAKTSEFMRRQPGFIRHYLVRPQGDDPIYVNIAEWIDRAALKQAIAHPDFPDHARALRERATSRAEFCDIVHETERAS